MGKREDLQDAARTAKAMSADFNRIADAGGEGPWDAVTAREMRDLSSAYADKYTRKLANGKR